MRAIWKGSIAFGLVHIPVNLYPATETQSMSSNLLHKKDHSRIRYQRISEVTGKEVPAEESAFLRCFNSGETSHFDGGF